MPVLDCELDNKREFPIADGVTIVDGDLVALNSSRRLILADANLPAKAIGFLRVAKSGIDRLTGNSSGTVMGSVLKRGLIRRRDIVSQTIGAEIFLSTTGGLPTATRPSTAADKIQPIGYIADSNASYTDFDFDVAPCALAVQAVATSTVAFG